MTTPITKERVQWLHDAASEFMSTKLKMTMNPEDIQQLTTALLAAMDAEPVASCIIEDGSMCIDGFGEYVGHSLPDGTHQLYTAPPAPVVPEEKPMPNPLSMYAVDAVAAIAEVKGWNACRAAMLDHSGDRNG